MNDQFKKYVDENREAFDHLEPSAAVFLKIKNELKEEPKEKKGIIRLIVNHKWMAAAAVLIIASISYLLLDNGKLQPTTGNVVADKKEPITLPTNSLEPKQATILTEESPKNTLVAVQTKPKRANTKTASLIDMMTVYKDLTDSSSASNRLAAILKIQKSGVINNDIVDRLANTLNADGNSNVRLAALNLMGQYAQDSYIANTFLKSLNNQKDPIIQLGLIDLLSQTNNPKLDDKLYALANDPTTFAAVKDQAYLVLLNQNKL